MGPCLQLILIYVFHVIYFEMLLLRVLSVRAWILTDVGGVLCGFLQAMGYCLSPGLDKWFSSLTSVSRLELAFVSLLLHDSEHHTSGLGRWARVQGGRIKCCSFGLAASPSGARRLCGRGFLLAPSHGMGMSGQSGLPLGSACQ